MHMRAFGVFCCAAKRNMLKRFGQTLIAIFCMHLFHDIYCSSGKYIDSDVPVFAQTVLWAVRFICLSDELDYGPGTPIDLKKHFENILYNIGIPLYLPLFSIQNSQNLEFHTPGN